MTSATSVNIEKTKTLVCDVMDVFPNDVRLLDNIFKNYGKKLAFHGVVSTIKCFEDNSKIWEIAEEDGNGRVLVVDGGGSLRHAIFGGNLGQKLYEKGWSGVIINGCIRDVTEQKEIDIGIKALGPCPRRAIKRNLGDGDVAITIAGVLIQPMNYIYADEDGIVVCDQRLHD